MTNAISKNIFRACLTLCFVYVAILGLVAGTPQTEELYFSVDYPPPEVSVDSIVPTTLNTIDENGVELHSTIVTAPETTTTSIILPPTTATSILSTTTAPTLPETTTTAQSARVANVTGSNGGVWDMLAECETGGNWSHPPVSIGYSGGLMFHHKTWTAMGGGQFASQAYLATREQQIIIAEKLLANAGNYSPWPGCRKKLGLA